ncbi:unnamed protein product [Phaeothamnion confervicola]
MREDRVDCTPRLPVSGDAALVVVNPGVKDMLCVRICQFQHTGNPVSSVSNSEEVWTVSGNQYRKAAGADLKAKRDWKRRGHKGRGYGGAIVRLSGTREKTVRLEPYLRALADVYPALQRELCSRGRRKTRWLVLRLRESWVEATTKRLMAPTLRPQQQRRDFRRCALPVGAGRRPEEGAGGGGGTRSSCSGSFGH